jgi:hypothetical protein
MPTAVLGLPLLTTTPMQPSAARSHQTPSRPTSRYISSSRRGVHNSAATCVGTNTVRRSPSLKPAISPAVAAHSLPRTPAAATCRLPPAAISLPRTPATTAHLCRNPQLLPLASPRNPICSCLLQSPGSQCLEYSPRYNNITNSR